MRLLPHLHRFGDDGADIHPLYRCECGAITYQKEMAIDLMHQSNVRFSVALIAWAFGIVVAIVLIAKLWDWSWS
jgi:hypothetical protein